MNPAWWSVAIGLATLAIALYLHVRTAGAKQGALEEKDKSQQKELDRLERELAELRGRQGDLAAVPDLLEQVRQRVESLDRKVDRFLERRSAPRGRAD